MLIFTVMLHQTLQQETTNILNFNNINISQSMLLFIKLSVIVN